MIMNHIKRHWLKYVVIIVLLSSAVFYIQTKKTKASDLLFNVIKETFVANNSSQYSMAVILDSENNFYITDLNSFKKLDNKSDSFLDLCSNKNEKLNCDNISLVARDEKNNTYLLYSSNRKVASFSPEGELRYVYEVPTSDFQILSEEELSKMTEEERSVYQEKLKSEEEKGPSNLSSVEILLNTLKENSVSYEKMYYMYYLSFGDKEQVLIYDKDKNYLDFKSEAISSDENLKALTKFLGDNKLFVISDLSQEELDKIKKQEEEAAKQGATLEADNAKDSQVSDSASSEAKSDPDIKKDTQDTQKISNAIVPVNAERKSASLEILLISPTSSEISKQKSAEVKPFITTSTQSSGGGVIFDQSKRLTVGNVGQEVVKLQQALSTKYPEIYTQQLVTGYFGPLTQQAVKKVQCKFGIVCQGSESSTGWGVVGPKTKQLLQVGQ